MIPPPISPRGAGARRELPETPRDPSGTPLAEEEDSLIADAEVSSTGVPVLVRSNNENNVFYSETPLNVLYFHFTSQNLGLSCVK